MENARTNSNFQGTIVVSSKTGKPLIRDDCQTPEGLRDRMLADGYNIYSEPSQSQLPKGA